MEEVEREEQAAEEEVVVVSKKTNKGMEGVEGEVWEAGR